MSRYLVERTFSPGASTPAGRAAPDCCDAVIRADGCEGVTWVQSFVTPDRRRTFCIVDAPSPEAIRVAAQSTALPVDRITEVRVLDPHAISMPWW
jgi:hypothetical protein